MQGELGNIQTILVRNPEEKSPLGRTKHKYKDNIKITMK
jgi:hypothetical protein